MMALPRRGDRLNGLCVKLTIQSSVRRDKCMNLHLQAAVSTHLICR
jgi:hypothetical protein